MATLSAIALRFQGELLGDDLIVERVARLEDAGSGDLGFLSDGRYRAQAEKSKASAILITRNEEPLHCSCIRVDDPYAVFTQLLQEWNPPLPEPHGIHPTAVIGENVVMGENVSVGPLCVVGDRCTLGDGTILFGQVWVGSEVSMGENCRVYPHVSLYDRVRIGNRVVIKDGSVIGSAGFAFHPDASGKYSAVPQLGTVILEDDVSVGANSCIDRALSGATVISAGTKLDNLVQVAHNARIGVNNVIAAQTGVSGSTKIGANNRIGGQSGFAGHLTIGDENTIAAQAGVTGAIGNGETVWGTPAIDLSLMRKIAVLWRRLPELFQRVKVLEERVSKEG